jgi:peroxin-14
LVDDQSVAQSSDVTDELLRITKISESGGAVEVNGVEVNGGSSVLNSSEIQEDEQSIEQS